MDIRKIGAAAAILVALGRQDAVGKDITHSAALEVRIYRTSVRPAELAAATETATRLFRRSGIDVVWLQCWSDPGAVIPRPDPCQRPLEPTEVIMHVVAGVAGTDESGDALGSALIDPSEPVAHVAHVYPARVSALARDGWIEASDLLGRAMAHEIGHLLMRSTGHASTGLMRARWTIDELRRNRPLDWAFSKNEEEAMREALAQLESGRDDNTTPHLVQRDGGDLLLRQ